MGAKGNGAKAAQRLLIAVHGGMASASRISIRKGGVFNRSLLGALFGKVAGDVMESCVTYLRISQSTQQRFQVHVQDQDLLLQTYSYCRTKE